MELTPLWEVQADSTITPGGIRGGRINLGEQRLRSENRLTERLVAMENKTATFEGSRSGEISIKDILAKLEKRMASMKKILSKVDEIASASVRLGKVVEALSEKVGIGDTTSRVKDVIIQPPSPQFFGRSDGKDAKVLLSDAFCDKRPPATVGSSTEVTKLVPDQQGVERHFKSIHMKSGNAAP
ncbi:MAG: hypothetical protein M1813_000737 [Trichoglossum hirsutum]|nr:MAG: hypothetical protein M1813_000737 [Trichoglossum hirsutum]